MDFFGFMKIFKLPQSLFQKYFALQSWRGLIPFVTLKSNASFLLCMYGIIMEIEWMLN